METISWNKHLTSSGKVEYATPAALFRQLDRLLGPFDLDACATAENTKVPQNFITPQEDALTVDWASRGKRIWANIPYSKDNRLWIAKAIEAANKGSLCAVLVYCRVDTLWFKKALSKAAQLILISGRVKFGGSQTNAPFGSCVLVFRPNYRGPVRVSLLTQEQ
jgi:phage N-6-adenine-methyltransferase